MDIDVDLKKEIIKHIKEEYPREACGLLVIFKGRRIYYKCNNISNNINSFIMDPKDFADAEDLGIIEYVVHSHPDKSCFPSGADKSMCYKSGIPWIIFSYPNINYYMLYPDVYKTPLIGREFLYGVFDCYILIQDYYNDVLNINLPDFISKDKWWENGEDLYQENFEIAGFKEISDTIQVNDVLLMCMDSKVINHGAIYTKNNMILHHLYGRLSSEDTYSEYYRNCTKRIIRYVKNN